MLRSLLTASLLLFASNCYALDVSDLWWNPAESGWGVSVTQQGDGIFALWFVYGTDGKPTWFVLSNSVRSGDRFSGDVYSTTGPVFTAAAFDPARSTVTKVGTATFDFSPPQGRATLTYTVDGRSVSKTLERQSFGLKPPHGCFGLLINSRRANCSFQPNDSIRGFLFKLESPSIGEAVNGALQIGPDDTITISEWQPFSGSGRCIGTGKMVPNGRYFSVSGSFTCGSRRGNFTMANVKVEDLSYLDPSPIVNATWRRAVMTGSFSVQDTAGESCTLNGILMAQGSVGNPALPFRVETCGNF